MVGSKAAGVAPPRDLVLQLVEPIAHRQLGRHLGDGKAGGLGGQGRGARDPGVHLDNEHAPIVRVDRELHIGAAGIDADLPQHGDRGVAHELVFLIRQGLGRGHRDGIAGMDPHGVQILDGADNDAVVLGVPHHLHLVLLPPQHRLLDQELAGGGEVQPAPADLLELLLIVSHAPAAAAQGKRGPNDRRKADPGLCLPGLLQAVGHGGSGQLQPDPAHGLAEQIPILRLIDSLPGGPNQLHAIPRQHSLAHQIQGGIERRLPPHGGQQGVRALLFDDAFEGWPDDGLDIGGIGHLRVRHDGGRVGIDQDDAIALVPQRLTGLGPGIVELAGLTDHNGTGADNQNTLDVRTLRHSDKTAETQRARSPLNRKGAKAAKFFCWCNEGIPTSFGHQQNSSQSEKPV